MGEQATYDHHAIEQHWQREWDDADVFRVPDDADDPEYVLAMFPYTSGQLHMGHVRNYAITDAFARYRRMDGEDVLHPMGWDSFGLPAENAANERDTNPREWTERCIDQMRDQFEALGFGYDWEREITTCDPDYYKWNQWLFTEFRDAGLVDRRAATVNWCPSCETVLADEQVEGDDELCWRCDTPVTERDLDQWFFETTAYADELLDGLDELDGWPSNVRDMQRNWVGRTDGVEVPFTVHTPDGDEDVVAFTTRVDTIHGATYFALAPDHPLAEAAADRDDDVAHFVEEVADPDGDEPQGVETEFTATNPATGAEIPVVVADFVLSDVGTGALMAVPAHDDRDHEFAQAHDLPVRQVVAPAGDEDADVEAAAYTADGVLVNAGDYTGLDSETAREELTADIDGAASAVQYQLRDWGVSRQRYWGTPIPIVHCESCGPVSVPDDDLPVELPEFVHTTGNPLDAAEDWKQTTCPDCGAPAVRETDTMDTFLDSSWYFLRFASPAFDDAPFDTQRANDWLPVDEYVGGDEHAVMHLLYSRFVTKAFADLDMLEHREPFAGLTTQGMVLGEDGTKMSKSKDNGVAPERIVDEYGADTARLFTLRAARPSKAFPWSEEGVRSSHTFLERLLSMARAVNADATADGDLDPAAEYVARETAATVQAATTHFDDMEFNRAVQAVDELVSLLVRYRDRDDAAPAVVARGVTAAVKLLAPIAPHVAEECWTALGGDGFVAEAAWPTPDRDVSDHDRATSLIEQTREDVRDIVDTAGIENPTGVDVVTAPEWMYDVLARAKAADGNVVGSVMSDQSLQQHGEDAADYAKDLAAQAPAFPDVLGPDGERDALGRAVWLLEAEFDAPVRVLAAEDAADSVANKAEPGRPAIHVDEADD
ncbi:leucine--tRNA ligase [Halobacterium salinarum]|uniref:Leucine--tRNA ligase n=6 Tax=Halobacterium salinarum TaxID=2242 RepID=SYL_HALSA|nr:leucine--tRNA ligase [Halobacterium salinarum]Q9HN72.1 RecName: Full=Leucine--tRNA ligase; AltName: Full=Leucyl-tRNA synthetase; Short=LeuRS [Halobacterium salinarum NRC-1]AAG20349.1 leucine-tRNA synthetase [Halobacterium salinarum NRC-1]MBB6089726.1 leucyl-tRNA synthetase [Halobacterium salinarum]MDL0119907.1 leucine--tRNA ligase [Halobacterium salinarum]MDL0129525.1 leucine--tRNA ligase [Halobacterium salinarum]MDL0134737.1 leucine--tRNA ligase [Halobacterium salinarum]